MLGTASIVSTVLLIILLIVITGIVLIGGGGALLSRSRGGTLAGGFFWAVLIPPWPVGLAFVWWRTRASAHARSEWADPLDDGDALSVPTIQPTEPPRRDDPPAGSGGRRF
jgi:hypothetical protein